MKPNHYIKKYKLQESPNFNHNDFINDFTFDFMALLEYMQQSGDWHYGKFKNCVKDMKTKWDSISNKTIGTGLPEKLWNYFFASVVAPIREEMFGDYLKAKKEQYEERKRERARWSDPFDGFGFFGFGGSGGSFWEDILKNMKMNSIPTESFDALGLMHTADVEAVKNAYRSLVMIHHPDKGGNSIKFVEVTDAKNKCLAYLS